MRRVGVRLTGRFPRWPAAAALLASGAAYALVADSLTIGPSALPLLVVAGLLVPTLLSHADDRHRAARALSLVAVGAVTLSVAASSLLLLSGLGRAATPPQLLLRDAALLWTTNVVIFAVWYWEVDGGGPAKRQRGAYESRDFLFPQLASGLDEGWSPDFIDYLFLAFNTSTAFSPTDTAVLSRRAKVLSMAQATLSLLLVAVLAARAVNALGASTPSAGSPPGRGAGAG